MARVKTLAVPAPDRELRSFIQAVVGAGHVVILAATRRLDRSASVMIGHAIDRPTDLAREFRARQYKVWSPSAPYRRLGVTDRLEAQEVFALMVAKIGYPRDFDLISP